MARTRRPTLVFVALISIGLAITSSACTTSPGAPPTADPPVSATVSATAQCLQATETPGLQADEVGATGDRATLYGLVFATVRSIKAGDDVKIVWRMTGQGPVTFTAYDPNGTERPLAWGPEPHGGQGASNYHRPGSEWGVGYTFGTAGCWRLHAQRTVGSADIWLTVHS
jgi:hypothetical protein